MNGFAAFLLAFNCLLAGLNFVSVLEMNEAGRPVAARINAIAMMMAIGGMGAGAWLLTHP